MPATFSRATAVKRPCFVMLVVLRVDRDETQIDLRVTVVRPQNGCTARVIMGEAASMTSSDLWDAETAERYDETSAFMFAP
ncbi:MAG TPA: hypothetical protein VFG63_09785, partial [Nocardioidaceae bacterium]|nr:hypothetical protein [Nocardioidaceae bacterium]